MFRILMYHPSDNLAIACSWLAIQTSVCAGPGGLVFEGSPGIFLQGLATYGPSGSLLPGPSLDWDVVDAAFRFAEAEQISCCAFLGDTCATTFMTPYIEELHSVFYEPLSQVTPLEDLMAGPQVKKLLFMSKPEEIDDIVKPHMAQMLKGTMADTTQAVDSMLEIVPRGVPIQKQFDHFHPTSKHEQLCCIM